MQKNAKDLYSDVIKLAEKYSFDVTDLGKAVFDNPIKYRDFFDDSERISYFAHMQIIDDMSEKKIKFPSFQVAGPREKIHFEPLKTKAAIITCGGLCPGINNVIRNIVLTLYKQYGVRDIYGFKYGYRGLNPDYNDEPLELTPEIVDLIHEEGGSILGSSRGNQPIDVMVETLVKYKIDILFCIGGDGTLKGAHQIYEEITRRKLNISIIGVPKTVDNDLGFIERTFGYETAVFRAYDVISSAYYEAKGAYNCISLIKLMGRDSGFIAAGAVAANPVVDICLIPELDFKIDGENGVLKAVERCIDENHHCVIVVSEGAGQNLFSDKDKTRDASGNFIYEDIGIFLKNQLNEHFKKIKKEFSLKYFDPSYIIRSAPAFGIDSVFCNMLGENAVHAGMSGKTDTLIGYWNRWFLLIPIELTVLNRKKVDLHSWQWHSVLLSTDQEKYFNIC